MLRHLAFAALSVLLLNSPVFAQAKWAADMFPVKTHEFGSVAKGAKVEYAFELQNLYKEDIHIASVRASCGCTTPSIVKDTLKSWEKGAILAKFNTSYFKGQKGATVTVVIDKPYYAEVQLQVSGFIREDVVFEPGLVNLGQLDQGAGGEAKVRVNFMGGRQNWTIQDVQSANTYFEVELSDAARTGGIVSYLMTVRLKADAPVGFINDQLTLVTDEVHNQMIPLTVEGRVQPALDVSPASILVGTLEAGQSVTKQLVVKSKRKFHVTNVKSDYPGFDFKKPEDAEPKTLHLIPVTFTAREQTGPFQAKITIDTDLGFCAECKALGTVKGTEAAADASSVKNAAQNTTAQLPR